MNHFLHFYVKDSLGMGEARRVYRVAPNGIAAPAQDPERGKEGMAARFRAQVARVISGVSGMVREAALTGSLARVTPAVVSAMAMTACVEEQGVTADAGDADTGESGESGSETGDTTDSNSSDSSESGSDTTDASSSETGDPTDSSGETGTETGTGMETDTAGETGENPEMWFKDAHVDCTQTVEGEDTGGVCITGGNLQYYFSFEAGPDIAYCNEPTVEFLAPENNGKDGWNPGICNPEMELLNVEGQRIFRGILTTGNVADVEIKLVVPCFNESGESQVDVEIVQLMG